MAPLLKGVSDEGRRYALRGALLYRYDREVFDTVCREFHKWEIRQRALAGSMSALRVLPLIDDDWRTVYDAVGLSRWSRPRPGKRKSRDEVSVRTLQRDRAALGLNRKTAQGCDA
jgi:hypothetical protein